MIIEVELQLVTFETFFPPKYLINSMPPAAIKRAILDCFLIPLFDASNVIN